MGRLELFLHDQPEPTPVLLKAALAHVQFETIHPFLDGNGRLGRILIQAMLLKENLPPAIIRQEKKMIYIQYLNKAQIKGDHSLLEDFICDSVLESFKILDRRDT